MEEKMKARAIQRFVMGDSTYEIGDVMDFPEEKVKRLESEGLAEALEERAPQPQIAEPKPAPVQQPPAAPKAKPSKSRK
jgi:hypothetical protein